MQFYTESHRHYCGIDLHAKSMYICVIDQEGTILYHKNQRCGAEQFLRAIQPYREDLVVAVECVFTWYWLADLCEEHGIRFVLGHALAMKIIHGSKTKSDKIDSQKIAMLLRAGMFPKSYVYSKEMRATRDLLRRRMRLTRMRAELQGHITMTVDQHNLPALPVRTKTKSTRSAIAPQFPEGPVREMIQLDVDLMNDLDGHLLKLERSLQCQAQTHDPVGYQLLRTIPGCGKILSLVVLYEIGSIERFETVQKFASYARLVRGDKESAGKRLSGGHPKMGNAFLKWAFSEMAVLFLRGNPGAQKAMDRLRSRHGKGRALSILSHKLGRSVFTMLRKQVPFDTERFTATI